MFLEALKLEDLSNWTRKISQSHIKRTANKKTFVDMPSTSEIKEREKTLLK